MSTRVEITDQVTAAISCFRGEVWVHIRRKDKSVSLSSKDFEKLLQKKNEIREGIEHSRQERPHGKRRKREESSPEYEYC